MPARHPVRIVDGWMDRWMDGGAAVGSSCSRLDVGDGLRREDQIPCQIHPPSCWCCCCCTDRHPAWPSARQQPSRSARRRAGWLPVAAPPRSPALSGAWIRDPSTRLAGVRQPPPWLALRALPINDVRFTDADAPGLDGYPTALWGSWGAALPGLDSHHRTTTRQHPIYLTPDPPSINEENVFARFSGASRQTSAVCNGGPPRRCVSAVEYH